ncbi:MAG: MCP four helix bundle domain-containing protein, partial [Acidobacteria bacterium]|nr:MCP four helix bundle domain-containing protein [Acidobacteriota bacterium]
MTFFSNLKIRAKLTMSFLLLAALAGVVGWFGYSNSSQLAATIQHVNADVIPSIRELGYANAAFLKNRLEIRDMLLTRDLAKRRESARQIDELTREFNTRLKAYRATLLIKQEEEICAELETHLAAYLRDRTPIVEAALQMNDKKALDLLAAGANESQTAVRERLRALIDLNAKIGEQSSQAALADASAGKMRVLISLAIVLLLSIAFGQLIARSIGNPIRGLASAAAQLAEGDVNVKIETGGGDELGDLSRSFSSMAAMLSERVQAADQIAGGNLNVEITARSERDTLARSFVKMIDTLRRLVAESEKLSTAAVEGRLEQRGDAQSFQGSYREIVQGVNRTLDAVIGPLTVAA